MRPDSECYCSVQAALAACIRAVVPPSVTVSAYEQAGLVNLPYVTIESTGDGDLSTYSGGSTERNDSVITAHACRGSDAVELAEHARAAVKRCSASTMAGVLRVVRVSHVRVQQGDEEGEFIAAVRVTHLTTRRESNAQPA